MRDVEGHETESSMAFFGLFLVFGHASQAAGSPIRVKPKPTVLKMPCPNHWTSKKFLLWILNAMIRNVCYILLWLLGLNSFFLQEKYTSPFIALGFSVSPIGGVYISAPLTLGLVM